MNPFYGGAGPGAYDGRNPEQPYDIDDGEGDQMTDKPKMGRPPKPPEEKTHPYSVRLTLERIAKLKLLKSAWLNKAIDRAKVKE